MPNEHSPRPLAAENEDLRARLEKAEETLREVRSGEADALFIEGVDGAQLFTLKGADHSYQTLIEGMSEGALTVTAQGLILYANRRFAEMIKTPLEKVIGATLQSWIAPDSQPLLQSLLSQGVDEKRREQLELSASDGTRVRVYLSVSKLLSKEMPDSFCLVATDLTEQKRSEAIADSEKLARELLAASNQSRRALLSVIEDQKRSEAAVQRANRALRTLGECNEALVRAATESELLDSICRLIVEIGGYRLAWVGVPEQDAAKTVRPVAHYGHDDGYLATANISWADSELGRGPSGTAIRSGIVQVNQNFQTNPALAPWREAALARGYQSSIALPLKSAAGTLGVLTLYAAAPDAFIEAEVTLLQELAEDLAFGIETLRTRAERDRVVYEQLHHTEILRQSLQDSIKAIANTVEMRDPYTAGHQRRVGQLAIAIAREMGMSEKLIQGIGLAASIHDLGKISVPAEILAKPGKLSSIEMLLLKNHAQAGFDIIKDIKFPWPIATMMLQHHERQDGSGYPQGLKGEQILLESRIMAVADVVEAMASHRPYREALGIDSALKEIERGRGSVYDAAVVDACIRLFAEKRFAFST
jgi:PAS domain S-box-containing protein